MRPRRCGSAISPAQLNEADRIGIQALAHAESELATAKLKLATREDDLEKLQNALRNLEKESTRLTESQSHDRYSLELELERLQRDLANAEDELEQARADADDAKDALHALELTAESTVRSLMVSSEVV